MLLLGSLLIQVIDAVQNILGIIRYGRFYRYGIPITVIAPTWTVRCQQQGFLHVPHKDCLLVGTIPWFCFLVFGVLVTSAFSPIWVANAWVCLLHTKNASLCVTVA